MEKIFRQYVTGGLSVYLCPVEPSVADNSTYYVDLRCGEDTLRSNKYDNLDEALCGFDEMTKNLDKLIWEEDSNAIEEIRKC